jgi:hypothetical protein
MNSALLCSLDSYFSYNIRPRNGRVRKYGPIFVICQTCLFPSLSRPDVVPSEWPLGIPSTNLHLDAEIQKAWSCTSTSACSFIVQCLRKHRNRLLLTLFTCVCVCVCVCFNRYVCKY